MLLRTALSTIYLPTLRQPPLKTIFYRLYQKSTNSTHTLRSRYFHIRASPVPKSTNNPTMTTFSDPNYNVSLYSTFRPTYPRHLFTYLLNYHSPAPTSTHLDLGTGPGTVLDSLSPPFTTRYAVDISQTMLTQAKSLLPPHLLPGTHFHLSPAESLPFVADDSIAFITAAQAAHWFKQPEIWNELARVVIRPGGTVAFWSYTSCMLPEYPRASMVLAKYSQNPQDFWGGYWSQPGRTILEDRLRVLQPPNDGRWERVQRWEYEPTFSPEATASTGIVWPRKVQPGPGAEVVAQSSGIFGMLVKQGEGMMHSKIKLGEFESYVRTFSSVHSFLEAHPEHKSLRDGGPGDIVDQCFGEMREAEGWDHDWREMLVDVEWGHAVLCAKRTDKE